MFENNQILQKVLTRLLFGPLRLLQAWAVATRCVPVKARKGGQASRSSFICMGGNPKPFIA